MVDNSVFSAKTVTLLKNSEDKYKRLLNLKIY